MPFGKPQSRKINTDHLPGPIATSYRRIFTRHEPDIERLMFVLDTAEITSRFLGAVVLCSLRELVQKGKADPPLIPMGDPRLRLKKPSFGLWMEILREGSRRLRDCGDAFDSPAAADLASRFCGYVFDERGKLKGRPYGDLDAILVIRNKLHHPAEELDIAHLCEEALKLLNQALEPLSFFEDYPLYVVKQINLHRRRLSSSEYLHQCFLLQGEIDFPVAENDSRTWHTETNEVLLYRDDTSYLNLDPLFVYVHADEIDRAGGGKGADDVQPGLYCFAGVAAKSSGLLVTYLPCAGSSKSFASSTSSFRDPNLTDYLNQGVEEMLALLEGGRVQAAGTP